jgi:hypothetical protein
VKERGCVINVNLTCKYCGKTRTPENCRLITQTNGKGMRLRFLCSDCERAKDRLRKRERSTHGGKWKPRTVEQRFWSKVDKTTSCWNWCAGKTNDGYGGFWLKGRMLAAHRVSWNIAHGDDSIPDDLIVDHICRNRSCVRPDHLRLLSNVENVMCGAGPAALNSRKTHCKRGHPLSGNNLYVNRTRRHCKTCISLRNT